MSETSDTKQNQDVHSGNKYLRPIRASRSSVPAEPLMVDIYDVLVGYDVRCPALQHAIKKLLCAGLRGKGGYLQDLKEAVDAVNRAIELRQVMPLEPFILRVKPVLSPLTQELKDDVVLTGGSYAEDQYKKNFVTEDGKWEAVPCWDDPTDEDKAAGNHQAVLIGFKVRWSKAVDFQGRYLWVRHYLTDLKDTTAPSLAWCQNAAERDAARLTEDGKRPEHYVNKAPTY